MKGIDTNVLVRLLVRDDVRQTATADAFIAQRCSVEEPCLVNRVVLVELAWVLESVYGYGRSDVARALDRVIATAEFAVDGADDAWAALRDYQAGGMDFADCLIGKSNRSLGCDFTLTFDRKAARRDEFILLERP